jgi:hypothetical protein
MMLAKVRNIHDIQYHELYQLLNERLGDYVRLLPSCLHQVSMRCKHGVVISISEVKVVVLQRWDLSQLASFYADPLWDVCDDQNVL